MKVLTEQHFIKVHSKVEGPVKRDSGPGNFEVWAYIKSCSFGRVLGSHHLSDRPGLYKN